MTAIYRIFGWILAPVLVFALVTWVALEGGDVGILRTKDGDSLRTTHVWYAEGEGGALWLEAATPKRPWLTDVRRDREVELERDGTTSRWAAVAVEGVEAHDRVRALLGEKYGWADWWVGLIQDTSHSVAVRLDPFQ